MSKPAYAFRLDPDILREARKREINIVKVIEEALAKEILKDEKCPFCGTTLKKVSKIKDKK